MVIHEQPIRLPLAFHGTGIRSRLEAIVLGSDAVREEVRESHGR